MLMLLSTTTLLAQNSMVGDGFGGRLWYKPSNYTVGSYSAYTICGDSCGENNQLYGWGDNQNAQLGNGTITNSLRPVPVLNMTDVRYYTTGYCMGAIKNDNTGWFWGSLLGYYTPVRIIDSVKALDAGIRVCSYIKSNGTVWSIGINNYGEFGNGSNLPNVKIFEPSKMIGINTAVRVANGYYNNIILLTDGSVLVAGSNIKGGLGIGFADSTNIVIPIPVSGLSNIIDIKAIRFAMIALDSSGDVYTWGSIDLFGYIGNGTRENSSFLPIKINSLHNIIAISGCNDGTHFLALDANQNCYAWGSNYFSNLGTGNRDSPLSPILVATNVIDIMAGETFSYILKSDGSLWASGDVYSTNSSIWMNLTNTVRDTFTLIDPTVAPMNLCKPYIPFTSFAKTTDAACNNGGTINVTHVGGKPPYAYSIGNAYQNSNVFTNLTAGNYTVNVKDSVGCISTVITTVGSSTNSISNLAKSITNATCGKNNGAINLGAITGGVAPYQYNFNGNGFSSATNFTNLSAGNYSIVVKDANGCNYSTNAVINNTGVPSSANITETICGGRIYNFNGNNLTESGNYTDTLTNAAGCDSIINLQLTVTPTPVIHLGKDTLLCEGDTLRLDVTTLNATYVWQDGSTFPYYIVTQDGNYHVSVKTNCIDAADTIEVKYKSCEAINCKYFIPTAFTPNGDGNNDEFKIRSNCNLTGMLIIYNRYGNEVFKTTDLSIAWNGKYKEESLQADVYAYYAEFTLNGKTEKIKGNITLLR